MRHLAVLTVSLALTSLVLAGCAGKDNGGTPAAPTNTVATTPGQVVVQNITFNPATLTAKVGDTVTWQFDDGGVAHTVTSDPGSAATFDSGQQTSGTFEFTFRTAGRFAYHCVNHKKMHGTINVT